MKLSEALSILKPDLNTLEALKQAYKLAALKHHPDHGGDVEIMKMVNAAYELLQDENWTPYEGRAAKKATAMTDIVSEAWDKVKGLAGIKGEIIGTWIWVSGNTIIYKKVLKEAGFKWSSNKKAWYWHQGGYRKHGKKPFSMDDIKTMWGSAELKTGTMAIA